MKRAFAHMAYLTLLAASQLLAQHPAFQTVDDLPTPAFAPTQMYEDRQGFLWWGGKDGLFRYDGYDFRRMAELPEAPVRSIAQRPDGRLCAGLENGQLWVRTETGWQSILTDSQTLADPITGLHWWPDGSLWIATYGSGIWSWQGERLRHISGLPDRFVYALASTSPSDLWVGTDAGLSHLSGDPLQPAIRSYSPEDGLPDNIVRCLESDDQGQLWLGLYQGGICRFDPASEQFAYPAAMKDFPASAVNALRLNGGRLWIGTREAGLWTMEWDAGTLHQVALPEDEQIQGLWLDRELNLWVSSRKGGLLRAFTPLQLYPMALGESVIRAVSAQQDGQIWYSTDQGVYRMQPQQFGLRPPELMFATAERELPPVISMHHGEVYSWLGTFGAGLYWLHRASGHSGRVGQAQGLLNDNILSIASTEEGLWLATLGGVARLSGDPRQDLQVEHFSRADGLGENYIYQAQASARGDLWFATDGRGVTRRRAGHFEVFDEADSLSDRIIYSMTEDQAGNIWALSSEGRLFQHRDSLFVEVPAAFRAGRPLCTGLQATRDGALLLVHDAGLDRYDPATGLLISYGEQVGIVAPSPDLNALGEGPDGRIWIGSSLGLIAYTPLPAAARSYPTLILDQAAVFFQPTPLQTNPTFRADENHLSFDYLALWYQDPKAVRYRHQLSSYDLGWTESQERRIIYPRLTPGEYRFEVQAGLGGQFPAVLATEFRIRPPFWATWWFWLLVAAAITAGMYGLVRQRERRMARQAEREREHIRYQFDLLRSQVNPHFLFNSFNTLISLIEIAPKNAVTYVERLSDLFRSMLAYREETLISLEEELSLLDNYLFLQRQRYRENLRTQIEIPATVLKRLLPPLTLQMLVENAIKHNVISQAKPLTIELYLEGEEWICVRNLRQPKRNRPESTGLGLENIRKRYALLTPQKVDIFETETAFTVCLPLLQS